MKFRALFLLLCLSGAATCLAASGQAVLDEINLARTQPAQYAGLLRARMQALPGTDARALRETVAFLSRQSALPPLEAQPALTLSAQGHVSDQGAAGSLGHRGGDGSTPWARMARQGQWSGRAGENISYGYSDARAIVSTLIVDQGVAGKGHRKNLFCRDFKVVGVACGSHARFGSMCVIDFAGGFSTAAERPMLADSQFARYNLPFYTAP